MCHRECGPGRLEFPCRRKFQRWSSRHVISVPFCWSSYLHFAGERISPTKSVVLSQEVAEARVSPAPLPASTPRVSPPFASGASSAYNQLGLSANNTGG